MTKPAEATLGDMSPSRCFPFLDLALSLLWFSHLVSSHDQPS